MKILYNILNSSGLGADRWLWEGYKRTFTDAGHEFFTVTEGDDYESLARRVAPDFVFLDFLPFMEYCRRVKEVPPDFFRELKKDGAKILCMAAAGLDREEDTPGKNDFFRTYLPVIDACFSNFTPETTRGFKELWGKDMYFVPHAADTAQFFHTAPDSKFACDIAFVGSYYTQKRAQFDKLLLPLFKKYHVRVYGSGWTLRSRALRVLGGAARRAGLPALVKFTSRYRMAISTEDERTLYASAKVCVNIHEYFKDGTIKGFSNEREFKVPAAGGFEITDYVPGMERYYDVGKEIVAVKTPEEWFSKIDYYTRHGEEREAIRKAGTARVLREHTYSHRVKQLLDICRSL